MTDLPKPETMLAYASILEKPQYVEKNGVRFPIPTGEIIEAACAALRHCAAPTALPPAGWRDISTAPKDGTHVLVGTFPAPLGHITIATAHWFDSRMYGAKSGGAAWALSVNYDGDHSDCGVQNPTHWMPLPPAPQRTGE